MRRDTRFCVSAHPTHPSTRSKNHDPPLPLHRLSDRHRPGPVGLADGADRLPSARLAVAAPVGDAAPCPPGRPAASLPARPKAALAHERRLSSAPPGTFAGDASGPARLFAGRGGSLCDLTPRPPASPAKTWPFTTNRPSPALPPRAKTSPSPASSTAIPCARTPGSGWTCGWIPSRSTAPNARSTANCG